MDQDTPPPASPPPPAAGFDFNRPTIIALLYLGSFVTGISGLAGIVLAYIWRSEPMEDWEASHYTYLIRTFWIGLVASCIGVILLAVLVGIFLLIGVMVLVVVRCVFVLTNAQKHVPMPDPETLWA